MKICRDCKIEKNDIDFFKRKSNSDGLYSYCKECTKKQARITRLKYLDESLRKNREYKEKHREFLREQSLEYYYRNREKVLKTVEIYRKKNRDTISKKEALRRINDQDRFEKNKIKHFNWASKNRERLNEWQRIWYQNNKEKRRAHVVLNRAVQKGIICRPTICTECLKHCKPDGHHHDYSKPLDVIWICRACHSRKSPRTVLNELPVIDNYLCKENN